MASIRSDHASAARRRRLRWNTALGLALLAGLAGAGEWPSATPEQLHQLALEARSARDYPAMMAHLRAAAGAGDVASQELLATLLVAGPALHGGAVPADLCEAAHWARRALAQGSWLAPHQLFVLSGARQAQPAAARCLAP